MTLNFRLFKDDDICLDVANIKVIETIDDNCKHLEFNLENTKNIFDIYDNGCIFIRENNEFKFTLDTIKNESTYLLKEMDTTFDIKVERCEFKKTNEKLIIKYQLETDDNINKIEISKGESL